MIPWHYGVGGWEDITPELVAKLGLSAALSMAEIQAHPAMVQHQTEVLRARARRDANKPEAPLKDGLGEPARSQGKIPLQQSAQWIEWLQNHYQSPKNCARAYKIPISNAPPSWEELAAPFLAREGENEAETLGWADFRRVRDVMRFQADRHFRGISAVAKWSQEWDAEAPIRVGCHMILENQAISGWDFELQASAVKEAGSFYASFHPAHHLNEVEGELEIGAYLSAKLVHDFFKGGWAAMWESVGGPTAYSGTFPFAFDGNTLSKCLLSYLAAGLKGVGIWSWNVLGNRRIRAVRSDRKADEQGRGSRKNRARLPEMAF